VNNAQVIRIERRGSFLVIYYKSGEHCYYVCSICCEKEKKLLENSKQRLGDSPGEEEAVLNGRGVINTSLCTLTPSGPIICRSLWSSSPNLPPAARFTQALVLVLVIIIGRSRSIPSTLRSRQSPLELPGMAFQSPHFNVRALRRFSVLLCMLISLSTMRL